MARGFLARTLSAVAVVVFAPLWICATASAQPRPVRTVLAVHWSSEDFPTNPISVKDAGIGLDGVDLQRMFALSCTTKATGTGVGLSISRSIVEAHGGRLWAGQNADRGATFCFTVPVHPAVVVA